MRAIFGERSSWSLMVFLRGPPSGHLLVLWFLCFFKATPVFSPSLALHVFFSNIDCEHSRCWVLIAVAAILEMYSGWFDMMYRDQGHTGYFSFSSFSNTKSASWEFRIQTFLFWSTLHDRDMSPTYPNLHIPIFFSPPTFLITSATVIQYSFSLSW